MRIAFAVVMILLFSSASAYAQQLSFADLVIVHGHVWTVDPGNPRAEAVAIRDGHIVAVGSDAEIAKWAGPATKRIDAQGKASSPDSSTRMCISAAAEAKSAACTCAMPTHRRNLPVASANKPRSCPRANGCSAERGTTNCGSARPYLRTIGLTR